MTAGSHPCRKPSKRQILGSGTIVEWSRPKELDSVFSRYLSNTLVYATGTVRDAVA